MHSRQHGPKQHHSRCSAPEDQLAAAPTERAHFQYTLRRSCHTCSGTAACGRVDAETTCALQTGRRCVAANPTAGPLPSSDACMFRLLSDTGGAAVSPRVGATPCGTNGRPVVQIGPRLSSSVHCCQRWAPISLHEWKLEAPDLCCENREVRRFTSWYMYGSAPSASLGQFSHGTGVQAGNCTSFLECVRVICKASTPCLLPAAQALTCPAC
jgi:hypothetical protein